MALAQDDRHEILTSPVTLAELVSVLERRGKGDAVHRTLGLVRRSSSVVPLLEADFERAGHVYARERAHHRDFGIADALILTQAHAHAAQILTTDKPLTRNQEGVRARALG